MFAVVSLLDGIIVGGIVFYLIEFLFGDKPLVRLIKVLSAIGFGIAYLLLCAEINYGELSTEIGMVTGCIIMFGPIGLVAIILLLNYMFKKK